MKAIEAIEAVENETIEFMGQKIRRKNDYSHKVRARLQEMAEEGAISPSEYWKALKRTPPPESGALERYEIELLKRRIF